PDNGSTGCGAWPVGCDGADPPPPLELLLSPPHPATSRARAEQAITGQRPDVVHCENSRFPLNASIELDCRFQELVVAGNTNACRAVSIRREAKGPGFGATTILNGACSVSIRRRHHIANFDE